MTTWKQQGQDAREKADRDAQEKKNAVAFEAFNLFRTNIATALEIIEPAFKVARVEGPLEITEGHDLVITKMFGQRPNYHYVPVLNEQLSSSDYEEDGNVLPDVLGNAFIKGGVEWGRVWKVTILGRLLAELDMVLTLDTLNFYSKHGLLAGGATFASYKEADGSKKVGLSQLPNGFYSTEDVIKQMKDWVINYYLKN